MEIGYDNVNYTDLVEDSIQWYDFVMTVMNSWVL